MPLPVDAANVLAEDRLAGSLGKFAKLDRPQTRQLVTLTARKGYCKVIETEHLIVRNCGASNVEESTDVRRDLRACESGDDGERAIMG